jgi:hypothetical protein
VLGYSDSCPPVALWGGEGTGIGASGQEADVEALRGREVGLAQVSQQEGESWHKRCKNKSFMSVV